MTRRQKRDLYRILVSLALFAGGFFAAGWWRAGLFLAAWLLSGYDTVWSALRGIVRGQFFDEKFLMAVATIGAFALQDWPEGAAVMIFFRIGELFESCAVAKSRRSISEMMNLRPDSAWVFHGDAVEEVEPEEVQAGDLLRVLPGERIPVDGVVLEGHGTLDTAKITGESLPVEIVPGSRVLSGCVNLSGNLKIQAESAYAHSTVAKILELVESASEKKAKSERMITRFARYYTPGVVLLAVLLAVVPGLLFGQAWSVWIRRALTFLVISCPCALVISVPLSFFGGMGAASRHGMIVKGGVVLEQLEHLDTLVVDKTGTITTGEFGVLQVVSDAAPKERLLQVAALAEQFSSHPVSTAICRAAGACSGEVTDVEELPGYGVRACVNGKAVLVGNRALLAQEGITPPDSAEQGTVCYVAEDGTYLGYLVLGDSIRPSARQTVTALKDMGVSRVVMLTGDNEKAAQAVAQAVGIDCYKAGLLPQDKVSEFERLRKNEKSGVMAFAGDGVNDAPVLTMADVGIAMGGVGSDAAVEAADLVILRDDLSTLPQAVAIARKTCAIARENIIFALGIKGIVLLLGALGLAGMWLAVFADVGVSVLAICNAMRLMIMK